jgi:hypothetical protein
MEEKTADEIAAIFSAAGDSVTVINTAKTSDETDDEYKDKITSESFTAIDKAIVDGKKVYS